MSYNGLREKYRISDDEQKLIEVLDRKRAFDDLDAEVESYKLNGKAKGNAGKEFDPTDEEVERILDEYLRRKKSDWTVANDVEDMRWSILDVVGLQCWYM